MKCDDLTFVTFSSVTNVKSEDFFSQTLSKTQTQLHRIHLHSGKGVCDQTQTHDSSSISNHLHNNKSSYNHINIAYIFLAVLTENLILAKYTDMVIFRVNWVFITFVF